MSSVHLDSAERGFSFNKNAILDMRFDRTEGKKVSQYINELPEKEIEHILRKKKEFYSQAPRAEVLLFGHQP